MITSCPVCGEAYRAGSYEQAHEPGRLCLACWRAGVRVDSLGNILSGPPHYFDPDPDDGAYPYPDNALEVTQVDPDDQPDPDF
jgi:hypothetical protein